MLYVGVAEDLERRWRQHRASKPWWPQVQRQVADWYADRPEALRVEAEVIRSERPLFNSDPGYLSADGKRTPHRSIRIADDLWSEAESATASLSTDRGTAIKEFIRWYLRRPGAKLPERPPRGTDAG